jgi:nucleotide-binding universal stress UspA family protein
MLAIRTILFPTDFSDAAGPAFALACSLARDHGARLIVIHVTSVPDLAYAGYGVPGSALGVEEYFAHTRQELDRLQPIDPKIKCEKHLVDGDAGDEILKVAAEARADLIVMGTHGHTALWDRLMGSVAERVVRRADCPVLTLRHNECERKMATTCED